MPLSAGTIIWISCRPLIRLAAGVASGYWIAKADIFPPVASRAAGQIALKITLPCLLFSKITTAFTTDNVKVLGPLILVAVLYEIIGVAIAWIVQLFFWVPHRFRYGILIAGGWGNVGDLATAVILNVTQGAPFKGTEDQNLAVAYVSVFILVFFISFFSLGFHRWLAWDFIGPDTEPEIMQAKIKERRRWLLGFLLLNKRQGEPQHEHEKSPQDEELAISPKQSSSNRHTSSPDDATVMAGIMSHGGPARPLSMVSHKAPMQRSSDSPADELATATPQRSPTHYTHLLYVYVRGFIKGLFTPITTSIFIALPIAVIPKLKALFVEVPGVHMPPAPDGQPPLAFIQDIASFLGAASIPIGLICVGSSLARLKVPLNQWRTLPVGAISGLAIGRMVVLPVFGVLICHGLANVGILPKDDKVLLLVSMFLSCMPTATTQVYITQVYSGTGTAEDIAAFLVPQYILMFFTMTALIAYIVHTIF